MARKMAKKTNDKYGEKNAGDVAKERRLKV